MKMRVWVVLVNCYEPNGYMRGALGLWTYDKVTAQTCESYAKVAAGERETSHRVPLPLSLGSVGGKITS